MLRIHQDIVLNSSTLLDARQGVLVLPAQTRYEQKSGGTSTTTERRIRFTPEIPGPRIAEARAESERHAAKTGALIVPAGWVPRPVLRGGAQERGIRPGTQDAVAAAGFGAAIQRVAASEQRYAALLAERDALGMARAQCLGDYKRNASLLRIGGRNSANGLTRRGLERTP